MVPCGRLAGNYFWTHVNGVVIRIVLQSRCVSRLLDGGCFSVEMLGLNWNAAEQDRYIFRTLRFLSFSLLYCSSMSVESGTLLAMFVASGGSELS